MWHTGHIEQRGQSLPTPQRENAPAGLIAGITLPVERRLPARALSQFPSLQKARVRDVCKRPSDMNSKYSLQRDFAGRDLEWFQIDRCGGEFRYQSKNRQDPLP